MMETPMATADVQQVPPVTSMQNPMTAETASVDTDDTMSYFAKLANDD